MTARRLDERNSVAVTKAAEIVLDTSLSGSDIAFNPAELFLASIAACMIKGIERVSPLLDFDFRGIQVELTASRQDSPPRLTAVRYTIVVDTDENDHRLELLHTNVRKFGTISSTVAQTIELTGSLIRKQPNPAGDVAAHQAEIERVAEFNRRELNLVPAPGTDVLHEGP